MKHFIIILSVFLGFTATPAVAAHHENGDHDHGQAQHAGMAAAGGMIDLGAVTVKGVVGMAHMKDVRAAMAKMGQKTTHHFMVMFNDQKTGKPLDAGKVAVKITSPDGQVTGPMELLGMQGHFGADVILDQSGEYRFQIGSKLADGEARQFDFTSVVK